MSRGLQGDDQAVIGSMLTLINFFIKDAPYYLNSTRTAERLRQP